jgi:CubicO group peptidase (beta-lactamase class C family)
VKYARLLATLCVATLAACSPAAPHRQVGSTGDAFERISPSDAGYSQRGLDSLRDFLRTAGSESMLLLHEGKVVFEWGDIRQKRLLHSIRKPVLNALIGMDSHRACLQLDQTLASLGVDDIAPSLSDAEKQATLRHVLQSRSGVYHEAAAESDGMAAQRPARGSHAPGAFYYYNNWDFNAAGAIYEQCTGKRIHDAFAEQIAKPLGMLDYDGQVVEVALSDLSPPFTMDGIRSYERQRSQFPAYHFRLSAHDLALFGQLYLNHGQWNGRQLIPAQWIDESTQPISVIDSTYGLAYGMLWDVLVPEAGDARASFYHTGVGVHMLGVYPKHRLVLVHRVNTEQDFTFSGDQVYRMIRLVHAARRSAND